MADCAHLAPDKSGIVGEAGGRQAVTCRQEAQTTCQRVPPKWSKKSSTAWQEPHLGAKTIPCYSIFTVMPDWRKPGAHALIHKWESKVNFSRNYTNRPVTWPKGNRRRTTLFSHSVGWNPASQPPHIPLWGGCEEKSCEVGMARKRTCGTQASGAKPQVMHWTSKLLLLTLGNPLYLLSLITDLLK